MKLRLFTVLSRLVLINCHEVYGGVRQCLLSFAAVAKAAAVAAAAVAAVTVGAGGGGGGAGGGSSNQN